MNGQTVTRSEKFRLASLGDFEAVFVAETFALLSEVFGPYCFTVSGAQGDQQVVFRSAAEHRLFYIRMHEFVAEATDVYSGEEAPHSLSLLDGIAWLTKRFPDEAAAAGLDVAVKKLTSWLDRVVRVRFWSGALWRHLTFSDSFRTLLAPQAHFSKHTLLKLGIEVRRLRRMCERAGCIITDAEAVAAKDEYAAHLDGMMQYHATELAELAGRCFLAFHRLLKARFEKNPTNNLDLIQAPAGVTDDVYRYLYASTVVSFSGWTESRILEFIPETRRNLKLPYPQQESADPSSG